MQNDLGLVSSSGVRLEEPDANAISRAVVDDAQQRFSLTWDRFMRMHATAKQILARGFDGTVLDVGGYDGALALFLPGVDVDVIDPATTGHRGIRLNVETGNYQAVTSIDALEHVAPDERGEFLSELMRVTNRYLFLNWPTPDSLDSQKMVFDLTRNDLIKDHVSWPLPEPDAIADQLRQAGFTVDRIRHTSQRVWLLQYVLQSMVPELSTRTAQFMIEHESYDEPDDPLYDLLIAERIEKA